MRKILIIILAVLVFLFAISALFMLPPHTSHSYEYIDQEIVYTGSSDTGYFEGENVSFFNWGIIINIAVFAVICFVLYQIIIHAVKKGILSAYEEIEKKKNESDD